MPDTCAGSQDRESFYAAQRRHRRATWQISAVCLLAALLMGVPFSIATAPLFLMAVIVVTDLLNIIVPVADFFSPLITFLDTIIHGDNGHRIFHQHLVSLLLIALGSGSLLFLLLWLSIRKLVLRSGTAGILARLQAEEPDTAILEERQLLNIVNEIALAAGMPAPRVLLINVDVANGATFGSSSDDYTIVISRRLLAECDRDQTQAVIAHLIASAVNGDLRISMIILSFFIVSGMSMTLLNASASRESRAICRRLLRASFRPGSDPESEIEIIAALLQAESAEIDEDSDSGPLASVRSVLRIPVLLLYMNFLVVKSIVQLFILGPSLAMLWRTRRYLADAAAVQLTRNPEGLAGALLQLCEHCGQVPGGAYLSHLFIVGGELQQAKEQQRHSAEMESMRSQFQKRGWRELFGSLHNTHTASQRHSQDMHAGNTAEQNLSGPFSMLPPPARRLARLAKMGAAIPGDDRNESPPTRKTWNLAVWVLGLTILGPILVMMLMLVYSLLALSTMLGLGASMTMAMIFMSILHPLLRLL